MLSVIKISIMKSYKGLRIRVNNFIKKDKDEHILRLRNYTEHPGLRFSRLSAGSAEDFYRIVNDTFRNVLMSNKSSVMVLDLRHTAGLCHGFFDELLGRIVYDFGKENFRRRIRVETDDYSNKDIEDTISDWGIRRDNSNDYENSGSYKYSWYYNGEEVKKRRLVC